LGIAKIKKYAEFFGLGKQLGIDLPGEASGLVPDKEWKEKEIGERWYIGDTYHISIGQGYLTTTPLQIAAATAAIANGGTLFKPQIVDKIKDAEGNDIGDIPPEIIRENFISKENIDWVRKGMREGVISGSSRRLFNLPVEAAGKTGTAQFDKNKKPHAWSVSFAPYENPEIALIVLVEEGGEGHQAAVPVAKNVLEWYFTKDFPDQHQ
jgi:penicillin-binding protein 2